MAAQAMYRPTVEPEMKTTAPAISAAYSVSSGAVRSTNAQASDGCRAVQRESCFARSCSGDAEGDAAAIEPSSARRSADSVPGWAW